ncbi:hypothetical protein BDV98DRAFT_606004, partial [Pterulicium gracile]
MTLISTSLWTWLSTSLPFRTTGAFSSHLHSPAPTSLFATDRSGMVTSKVFSMTSLHGALVLVRVLAGIRLAPRFHLGFHPAITTKDRKRFIQIDAEGTIYEILETVFLYRGIRGRGTVVYKCRNLMGNHVAVKDAWVDEARKFKEPDLLAIINKNNVKGVLNMSHWIVEIDERRDCTDWIRSHHPHLTSEVETR